MKKIEIKNIINFLKQDIVLKITAIQDSGFLADTELQAIKQSKDLILILDKIITIEEKLAKKDHQNDELKLILSKEDHKIIENYLEKYKKSQIINPSLIIKN